MLIPCGREKLGRPPVALSKDGSRTIGADDVAVAERVAGSVTARVVGVVAASAIVLALLSTDVKGGAAPGRSGQQNSWPGCPLDCTLRLVAMLAAGLPELELPAASERALELDPLDPTSTPTVLLALC
jgi:hypothetical protein